MKRAGARPLEDMERNRPKHAGSNFYQAKKGEQGDGARPRQPAAGQAAKSQPKEKSGDDHSHRLNVDSKNREKGSLPNDLIDQCREAGRKKRRNTHRIQRRFTGSIVLRQSTCHAVPLLLTGHCAPTIGCGKPVSAMKHHVKRAAMLIRVMRERERLSSTKVPSAWR